MATRAKKVMDEDIMPMMDDDNEEIEQEASEPVKKQECAPRKKELSLEDLPGVGATTAEKLREAGFATVMSVAVASPAEIAESSGMSEAQARKIINYSRNSMEMGFESGMEILEKRKLIKKISTGSETFNTLMGGGFESGSITECFGEFGSGKTQIGHILAVQCQKDDPDGVAVYIDTENTFRPERIVQLAKGLGINEQQALSNIKVARAFNSDHQILLAQKVEDLINKGMKVKVLIVDSLTAHFRAEFIGRGTLAERQQKLNSHMRDLAKVAQNYNICVYVTNQVMAKPDQFFGDPTQAIGGHVVAHASTFRIYLRKGKKGSRVAKLIDAPNLADGEASFMVEEAGLRDI